MPLWNDADDRRAVRNRRSKAVARTRRRASAPHLEGLESRTLLSTAQGLGPEALPAVAAAKAKYVPNEVLVQYKAGAGEVERAKTRGKSKGVLTDLIYNDKHDAKRDAKRGALELITVAPGQSVEATIEALKADPAVAYAEPNWIYTTQATSTDPYYTNGSLWGMYGDSTGPANPFGSQAGEAWAAGDTGSRSVYVGIIDEGIDFNHPDLRGNVWTNPREAVANGIDDDGNGYIDDIHGWDFAGNNNTIYDGTSDDHGTHVAGTIAAAGNNAEGGVVGVNWNVTYISAKFLGATGGTTANAIKVVDYFTDLKTRQGLNIVATNNSWGGGGFSQGLLDAINRANAANILFIAAAGNNGANNDVTASYPANYNAENVIAVAAIANDGSLAGFSNYGATTVDIGAPGVGVWSTLPGNTYGSYNGTSMATPHVTGAAALYASKNPGATAAAIREAILRGATATPTASLSGKTVTGGRLNVAESLGSTPPTSPPASPPTNLGATAAGPNEVTLTWSDNSGDEAGFKIEQSTDNGTTFTQVATTGADVGRFTVTGLTSSTTYSFRVRAYNSGGNSGYTNNASVTTPAIVHNTIFTDNFNDNSINPTAWTFFNGTWSENSGVLKQTNWKTAANEELARVTNSDKATKVTAKVQVNSWRDGEFARAGVTLFGGYHLVFTGRVPGQKRLEIVNDRIAWSGNVAGAAGYRVFDWNVGTWYRFEMRIENGTIIGKVQALDAAGVVTGPEASLTFNLPTGWNRTGGLAGVNGGSSGTLSTAQGRSYATVSFDDVTVGKVAAATSAPATPAGVAGLSQADPSLPTQEATPRVVVSYPVPVEPASDSWVDSILAEIEGRRSLLVRRD